MFLNAVSFWKQMQFFYEALWNCDVENNIVHFANSLPYILTKVALLRNDDWWWRGHSLMTIKLKIKA